MTGRCILTLARKLASSKPEDMCLGCAQLYNVQVFEDWAPCQMVSLRFKYLHFVFALSQASGWGLSQIAWLGSRLMAGAGRL